MWIKIEIEYMAQWKDTKTGKVTSSILKKSLLDNGICLALHNTGPPPLRAGGEKTLPRTSSPNDPRYHHSILFEVAFNKGTCKNVWTGGPNENLIIGKQGLCVPGNLVLGNGIMSRQCLPAPFRTRRKSNELIRRAPTKSTNAITLAC